MIYFIEANKKVKIGYTANPQNRISDIQTSNPDKLNVLLIIDGGCELERQLHKDFADYRLNGEWFEYSDSISDFIDSVISNDRRYEFGFLGKEYSSTNQLKRLRTEKRLSLREVGEKLGISSQSVWETEERESLGNITIHSLRKTGNVLGYDLEYRFVPKSEQYLKNKIEARERAEHTMMLENGYRTEA